MTTWTHRPDLPGVHRGAGPQHRRLPAPCGVGNVSVTALAIRIGPATHYASSGLIEDLWLPALSDPDTLYAAAQYGASQQGIALTATHADCVAMLTAGDISSDAWQVACARLGCSRWRRRLTVTQSHLHGYFRDAAKLIDQTTKPHRAADPKHAISPTDPCIKKTYGLTWGDKDPEVPHVQKIAVIPGSPGS